LSLNETLTTPVSTDIGTNLDSIIDAISGDKPTAFVGVYGGSLIARP
jgi:hypothetical protein